MATIDEMINVMQAFQRGEEIEVAYIDNGSWGTSQSPCWDWSEYKYRIKPKTKHLWFAVLKVNADGRFITTNPCEQAEYLQKIESYRDTAKVIKEYRDTFEV